MKGAFKFPRIGSLLVRDSPCPLPAISRAGGGNARAHGIRRPRRAPPPQGLSAAKLLGVVEEGRAADARRPPRERTALRLLPGQSTARLPSTGKDRSDVGGATPRLPPGQLSRLPLACHDARRPRRAER